MIFSKCLTKTVQWRNKMFQTDPIIWLQSFSHPFLTFIMQVFTYAGYGTFFIIFILSFFYGVDHKKGWELFHLVLLGGFVTVLAKEFFSYPRPFYLTQSVKLWDPFLLKDFPLVKSFESISFFSLKNYTVFKWWLREANQYSQPQKHKLEWNGIE